MAAEDLSRAFEAVPGTPTLGAQASASENDGSHAAVAQGTHQSKLCPVTYVCCRDLVHTVEWDSHMLDDYINVCFDDNVFLIN